MLVFWGGLIAVAAIGGWYVSSQVSTPSPPQVRVAKTGRAQIVDADLAATVAQVELDVAVRDDLHPVPRRERDLGRVRREQDALQLADCVTQREVHVSAIGTLRLEDLALDPDGRQPAEPAGDAPGVDDGDGAIGEGDLGRHFSDSDPKYKGIDSRRLLGTVMASIREAGLRPVNVDATLIAQEPKLVSHIPAMCTNIATDLGVPIERVNVKATTTEHLGFIGRCQGIAAQVVVLLQET